MGELDWDLVSSYAGLLSLAVISIYAGSFASLPPPKSKSKEEKEAVSDRLSSEDAYLLPIIGSLVLYGLYQAIKYFGTEWVNFVLRWYFVVAGVGSVWSTLCYLARWAVGDARWRTFDKLTLGLSKGSRELVSVSLRIPSVCLIPVALIPSLLYAVGAEPKSALLTDLLSLSFSSNAISILKLDSFGTGCIVLAGLFLYDIWWVFGTDVMVNVATQVDAPIKLLWPKSIFLSTSRGFTMLGLGDVVVPGIFVALALRYDYHRASKCGGSALVRYSKPYFWAALTAYALGLVTTMSVMHIVRVAQPALLYLSPACISSFFLTSLVRGELKEAWSWSDEPATAEETRNKVDNVKKTE